jgi:hypothetical protein
MIVLQEIQTTKMRDMLTSGNPVTQGQYMIVYNVVNSGRGK